LSESFSSVLQYFLLGRTLKSHGTGGQLRLQIENKYKSYLKKGSFIFFELNGSKVPYEISGISDENHVVLTLNEIQNKKDSDKLSGLDLWIPIDDVKPLHRRSPKNIEGKWDKFSIRDDQTGKVYQILRVEEFPQQLMAVIQLNEKEMLIPLNDQLISSIDQEQKIIHMLLPGGLLEL
jgi:16S rRNA processing protein RimM